MKIFSVPAFFICFRETLEASIVLSVMLTLINKIVEDRLAMRKMKQKVWLGVVAGVLSTLAAAVIFLALYYTVAKKVWDKTEGLWEGILGLIAVVLITIMAFSMIRVDTWRRKWELKLTKVTMEALNKESDVQSNRSKWTLFLIPFTVVLREGVEAVIFLGGIGLDQDSKTAYPIPAVLGAACGVLTGYFLYRGGNRVAFKIFLGAATALLLVIAAGLFAGSVHEFEEYREDEHFLWQLNCCDPETDYGWSVLQSVFGWRNEATQGTLSAYFIYWLFVLVTLALLTLKWRRDAAREALSPLPAINHTSDPSAV